MLQQIQSCQPVSLMSGYGTPEIRDLENLEVVDFLGAEIFWSFPRGRLSFRGAVSPRDDLVLFGP